MKFALERTKRADPASYVHGSSMRSATGLLPLASTVESTFHIVLSRIMRCCSCFDPRGKREYTLVYRPCTPYHHGQCNVEGNRRDRRYGAGNQIRIPSGLGAAVFSIGAAIPGVSTIRV